MPSQLAFWLKNTPYSVGDYVLDGAGNIQKLTSLLTGGVSGSVVPSWTQTTTSDHGGTWTWQGFGAKVFELQKPAGSSVAPYFQSSVDAISFSRGGISSPPVYPDAGKYVLLNAQGQIDSSLGGGGGGSTLHVNGGSAVSNPNLKDSISVTWTVVGSDITATAVSGSTSFSAITTGTNTVALIVGSGGTLTVSGTGTIEATELATSSVPVNISANAPVHAGQLLISQPGNTSAMWADPLVQGLYPVGTSVTSPPINPVLVGAQSPSSLLENLNVDASGNLLVNLNANSFGTVIVSGTVAVTQSTSPWVVSLASTTITGTVAVTQSTSPWVVSGTVIANAGTNLNTSALALESGGNLAGIKSNLDGVISGGKIKVSAADGDVYVRSNAGSTFPVNATLSAETTKVIGTVNQGTSPWVISGAVTIASTTITGTVAVTQSTSPWVVSNSGTFAVQEATLDGAISGGKVKVSAAAGDVVVEVSDGTNLATVKAASTAALASDTALVVTEPGSTIAGAPANTAVTSTSSAVLAANTARREFMITNTDIYIVYIGLGQTPTPTAYHVALQPCSTVHDGTGGTFISDVWKGAVNAIIAVQSPPVSGHVAVCEMT